MVQATPEFGDHPAVINGCSELFAELFGPERGIGARSAADAAAAQHRRGNRRHLRDRLTPRMTVAHEPWWRIDNADDVPSPALLIYPDRAEANIRRMVEMAGDAAA